MKLHIAMLVSAMLLSGSAAHAQGGKQEPRKAKAYMVADAHLDTQWNWDVQTTIKEYVWNTISQNLFLLKKYPNYVFNFEGGVKYAWMKEYYPEQYEELKEFVKKGRWHISGSSWDATDAIVPSTESFIRNIMLGQQYYRKEFGVESTDIFLPDCFGFGWTLPTIAAHCGLIGFSSQKLDWRVHPFYGQSKHPFTIGLWKGIDGSAIMLAHGYDYGKRWNDEDLSQNTELQELAQRTPLRTVYRYYGTGDIGGSPTLSSVRSVEKGIRGNGPLEIISATSDRLFKDYLPYESHPELPTFDGELLMDVHGTGCYTSQAAMKLYNRQNETLGDAAERAAVTAEWLNRTPYPGNTFNEAWKRFIYHQFHDDLTGTSIPRAYEFSWNDELISLKQFSGTLASSVKSIGSELDTRVGGIPVILYNALGFQVSDIAEIELALPKAPKGVSVCDAEGRKVTAQLIEYKEGKAHILIDATVPPMGYAVYDVRTSGSTTEHQATEANTLENSLYKLTLDRNGDIVSLTDKKNHKELVKPGKAIRLALFTKNESFNWPAWEILKETTDRQPISITEDARITCVENGSLRKALCIEKRYGKSSFRQYIRLYEGSRAERIDFYNEVDWQSADALLKAEFPLDIDNEKATYDLGIGSIGRGNNTPTAYEVYAQYWADLTDSNRSYGISIMNDSKYGWDKPDNNTLRLTLLHTPSTRNNYAYQNRQDFGHHRFTYSLMPHAGALNKPLTVERAEVLNQPLKAFRTEKHKGSIGKTFSFATSDNRNVLIKALKKAEESDEYVVRVYETGGETVQTASLTFAADITGASEANGTEKTIGSADYSGNRLHVSIAPYSVKTYKVRLKASGHKVDVPQQTALPLAFNRKCASYNAFRGEADFESGYSFAAELLPDSLVIDHLTFRLGEKETFNGMTCKGDTLQLPAAGRYNRLYILAASTEGDHKVDFRTGKQTSTFVVPSYTGFIGQWGHTGHTEGYLKEAEIAYVGTHRHAPDGDHPYEFTYIFKFGMDIPKEATSVVLPHNENVVLFAATLAQEDEAAVMPASTLFHTANRGNATSVAGSEEAVRSNLLKSARILACSGFTNDREKPEFLIDGNADTKWCDITQTPNYVDFDLGEAQSLSGWRMLNAGQESHSYITNACFLQGKANLNDEWTTLDAIDGNRANVISRPLNADKKVRYIRLLVTRPTQTTGGRDVRIYELEIYK